MAEMIGYPFQWLQKDCRFFSWFCLPISPLLPFSSGQCPVRNGGIEAKLAGLGMDTLVPLSLLMTAAPVYSFICKLKRDPGPEPPS